MLADDFDLGQVHQQHGSLLGEETQKESTWVLEEASELYRQGFQSPRTPRVIEKGCMGSEWTRLLSPLAFLPCGEVHGGTRNTVGPYKAHAQFTLFFPHW